MPGLASDFFPFGPGLGEPVPARGSAERKLSFFGNSGCIPYGEILFQIGAPQMYIKMRCAHG